MNAYISIKNIDFFVSNITFLCFARFLIKYSHVSIQISLSDYLKVFIFTHLTVEYSTLEKAPLIVSNQWSLL